MRFSEIIREDSSDVTSLVLDIVTSANAEGMTSLSVDTLAKSLSAMGQEVDHALLFDLLDAMPVIDNIKDDIIYFGSDGHTDSEPTRASQENHIDKMARKQIKKDL